jgi:hypothetical protein
MTHQKRSGVEGSAHRKDAAASVTGRPDPSTGSDELAAQYPWMSEEDIAIASEHPAVLVFIEEGEDSLNPALDRWLKAQDAARRELKVRGLEIHPRMRGANGVYTTALELSGRNDR